MNDKNLAFEIIQDSGIPKYRQLVNAVNDAIANHIISIGELLPSVNNLCQRHGLSRDTVFKAYSILKEQGVIESVPNKGYYVARDTRKILLVLDTFKAYKEVLYHSFVNNLPDNFITDVQFHHYNIENFKTIVQNSKGQYFKYIIMPFEHKEVPAILTAIQSDKLLLVDWNIHGKIHNNYVYQDFGVSFYETLKEVIPLFKKYKEIHFVYPSFTNHPSESVTFFEKFCKDFAFTFKIITNPNEFSIKKHVAYISVSDRMLGNFLEQCRVKDFEPGVDVGILSYNETPMKKFIYKGITVVSTDFKELGTKAAEFVKKGIPIRYYVPTKLLLRDSL